MGVALVSLHLEAARGVHRGEIRVGDDDLVAKAFEVAGDPLALRGCFNEDACLRGHDRRASCLFRLARAARKLCNEEGTAVNNLARHTLTIDIETLPSLLPVDDGCKACKGGKIRDEHARTALSSGFGRILCIGFAEGELRQLRLYPKAA